MKGELRVVLMLQCHKGYKQRSPVHARECFGKHREAMKLTERGEVHVPDEVEGRDRDFLWDEVGRLIGEDGGLEDVGENVETARGRTKEKPTRTEEKEVKVDEIADVSDEANDAV